MATACDLTYVPLSIVIKIVSFDIFESIIFGDSESLSLGTPLINNSLVSSARYFFIF